MAFRLVVAAAGVVSSVFAALDCGTVVLKATKPTTFILNGKYAMPATGNDAGLSAIQDKRYIEGADVTKCDRYSRSMFNVLCSFDGCNNPAENFKGNTTDGTAICCKKFMSNSGCVSDKPAGQWVCGQGSKSRIDSGSERMCDDFGISNNQAAGSEVDVWMKVSYYKTNTSSVTARLVLGEISSGAATCVSELKLVETEELDASGKKKSSGKSKTDSSLTVDSSTGPIMWSFSIIFLHFSVAYIA